MKRTATILAAAFAVALATPPEKAHAIKAWATRYGVDCAVCHQGPLYKLTPVGTDFLRRGHRLTTEDTETPKLDDLFSVNTKLRAHDSNAPGRNSTFEVHAFSIYTGGAISRRFSYFTEMYLYENTGKTSGATNGDFGRGKLADAYLEFNTLPSHSSYTTVKFGQVSPSQPLIYWNVGPRYSETRPYIVNNSAVAPNTYRPFMRNFGLVVAQHVKGLHAELGILNGTGSSPTNSIDNNESKDFFGTLDLEIGNSGSAIGVYGYKGRGLVTPATGPTWENEFHRYGAFGQFTHGKVNITGVVTRGEEQLTAQNVRARNLGLLGEFDFSPAEKLALFARYDYFDPNTGKENDHQNGPVLGTSYRLLDSGRVTFEWHKQGKYSATTPKPWEYRLELAYMF